jgi:hypothetical protein
MMEAVLQDECVTMVCVFVEIMHYVRATIQWQCVALMDSCILVTVNFIVRRASSRFILE